MDIIIELGFDGINFGNTSTDYLYCKNKLNPNDIKNFDYFVKNFGGGVSGYPLKEKSLLLASEAAIYINSKNLSKEFHVIRTGGIENINDLNESEKSGISLNQWFTGYFEAFSKYGHNLYNELFKI